MGKRSQVVGEVHQAAEVLDGAVPEVRWGALLGRRTVLVQTETTVT